MTIQFCLIDAIGAHWMSNNELNWNTLNVENIVTSRSDIKGFNGMQIRTSVDGFLATFYVSASELHSCETWLYSEFTLYTEISGNKFLVPTILYLNVVLQTWWTRFNWKKIEKKKISMDTVS